MTTSAHPAPARGNVSLRSLWFGLFGAPAAWSVQTLADYSTNAHTCFPRLYPLAIPTIGAGRMWVALAVISIIAIVIAALALVVAIHSYRATRDEAHGGAHEALEVGEGRTRFMALSGAMLSALFLLATLVHSASLILVPACGY